MIALSIALALVGLVALWTARDVLLRIHRGSEATEALRVAREAQAAVQAAREAAERDGAGLAAKMHEIEGDMTALKASGLFRGRR